MPSMCKARYRARFADDARDLRAAQALRHRCFRKGNGVDSDRFDDLCRHVLVDDATSGQLAACFRLFPLAEGHQIHDSYSAQFYDLTALGQLKAPMVEVGRFCIDPEAKDGVEALRVAWGSIARYVDEQGIAMLFGCSTFHGTDPIQYRDAFAVLHDRHLAPKRWRPRIKAPHVIRFSQDTDHVPDLKRAAQTMPPLLRSYLVMGGCVSDHAVVDRDLDTLHVFTGVEVNAVPPARARLLRTLAGAQAG